MAGVPYDPPAPPLPRPYNHSRAGMVNLTINGLAEAVVPNLAPTALMLSAPCPYRALATRYPDGWSSPWYMATPGHVDPGKPPGVKCTPCQLWGLSRQSPPEI
ncbi:hypothetical protein DSO57_1039283 [Entomophthora muscae]|uniref:Uncharacterized protein n=1 Tax=Entomophthora muscae TaxID=34485 RepID=A0ACC2RPL0_9FUNG|nr:hypothetical protein DSO57_1039283 [Entomophthora muscae]